MKRAVEEAFEAIPREHFLPEEMRGSTDLDVALPIGFGQTNSQPSTVARMLDWLDVEQGDKVLDIGSGSGWTTALMAELTGEQGMVHAVELVPELLELGRGNCQDMGIRNVRFHQAGKEYGWPDEAPFDRILVSAAAEKMPEELFDQLKPGGRLVVPVRETIHVVDKDEKGRISQKEHRGFAFVPLVKGKDKT